VDAVGRDQGVERDARTVCEKRPHLAAALLDAHASVRQMHPLGRHGLGEQRMQLAAMEDVVRRAEFLLDRLAERRAGQRFAVLPAALVKER
jgi:hypothetical protein